MPKKSRRNRQCIGHSAAQNAIKKMHGFDSTPTGESRIASLREIDGVRVMMPPEIPPWKTHTDALAALTPTFREAAFAVQHESSQICNMLQKLVAADGLHVNDITDVLPTGPEGNHSVFPVVCAEVDAASKKHPLKVYVIVRTPHNTPAYLGGTLYGMCGNMGGLQIARQAASRRSTPAALLIMAGKHLMLPAIGIQGGAEVAARALAAMVLGRPEIVTCVCCNDSLMRIDGSHVELDRFLTPQCCNTLFHPECLFESLKSNEGCPACGARLPEAWLPKCVRTPAECGRRDLVSSERG